MDPDSDPDPDPARRCRAAPFRLSLLSFLDLPGPGRRPVIA
nr:hypothetical protein [Delftia acidovorans]